MRSGTGPSRDSAPSDSGGVLEGTPLLLLITPAPSGADYVNPLGVFTPGDGTWVVIAADGGSDHHPSWYFNLRKRPTTTGKGCPT